MVKLTFFFIKIFIKITSGLWIQDIFIFTNINGKINYSVSGKVFNYTHTDKKKLKFVIYNDF